LVDAANAPVSISGPEANVNPGLDSAPAATTPLRAAINA
jgi:hypothetical protein